MLRRSFLIVLLFGVSYTVQAQAGSQGKKRPRIIPWTISDRFTVSLTPSSFLDPYGALGPVGLAYYFGDRYSAHAEFGFPLYYVLNNYAGQPRKTVNSDFKIRTSVQQYFLLREKSRCFFGAEMAYRCQEMYLKDSYLHYVNGKSYDYSGINATKTVYSLGAFLGLSRKLSERFLIDGHLGLGLRVLNMETNLDITGLTPRPKQSFTTLIPPNEDRVGDRDINIYLPFAIKIAYLL